MAGLTGLWRHQITGEPKASAIPRIFAFMVLMYSGVSCAPPPSPPTPSASVDATAASSGMAWGKATGSSSQAPVPSW